MAFSAQVITQIQVLSQENFILKTCSELSQDIVFSQDKQKEKNTTYTHDDDVACWIFLRRHMDFTPSVHNASKIYASQGKVSRSSFKHIFQWKSWKIHRVKKYMYTSGHLAIHAIHLALRWKTTTTPFYTLNCKTQSWDHISINRYKNQTLSSTDWACMKEVDITKQVVGELIYTSPKKKSTCLQRNIATGTLGRKVLIQNFIFMHQSKVQLCRTNTQIDFFKRER